jgi:hypothetical protein
MLGFSQKTRPHTSVAVSAPGGGTVGGREQHKAGPGVVPGRANAAPCRHGYPIWLPAAGVPRCPSLSGPTAAQARNVPISTSCAGCLRYAALAGRDNHGLPRLIRWSRGR